jgi:hypothetical protein
VGQYYSAIPDFFGAAMVICFQKQNDGKEQKLIFHEKTKFTIGRRMKVNQIGLRY